MDLNFVNKRFIFNPNEHLGEAYQFAQSPQCVVFEKFVRVYFSTRTQDVDNGKFRSHIRYADFDKKFSKVLKVASTEVIALGALGTFDEHGIFPINLLKEENRILAYTCGWSRRTSVSVETSTGLAISLDGGETFSKMGEGPVLTSSLKEPFLVGDSFVRKYNERYHMWYIFGKKWMLPTTTEPEARIYKIGYASSTNGVDWVKNEGEQIVSDVLNENECQALPSVIKIGNMYHMVFCFREATDFRNNDERSYRLGYASSSDLKTWVRNDKHLKLEDNASNIWDSNMKCYPHLVQVDDKVFLLYNGNAFGKEGFGIAELQL